MMIARKHKMLFTLAALAASFLSSQAMAAVMTAGTVSGAPGANVTVPLTYTADASTIDFQADVTFNPAGLIFVSATPVAAGAQAVGSCARRAAPNDNQIRFGPPAGLAAPAVSGTYCNVVFMIPAAAPAPSTQPLTVGGTQCFNSAGDPVMPCTGQNGAVNIVAGGGTAPTVSALPATTLSAGATGGTATGNVPVTVATAGTAPGSLALTCSIPAGANAFTITGGGTRTINAPAALGANAPPIGVSCTRTAGSATATLTCLQNATPDPDPAALTATITCPAGTPPADVSPNIAFTPNPLTLTGTGTATGTLTGTPSGGTGAATTTATCVDDAGGPAFTITPASRMFTGTTTTAQTYAIGCTTAVAAASGTITCSQVQSDGTNPAPTVVTVNCPATAAGPGPEYSSVPPGGTTISLNGTQGGPPATSLITVTNTEAGTTLTVTPSGLVAPLSITPAGTSSIAGGASQVFTVSCSTAAVGTFNQTLTMTTNDPDDGETTVTYPVTCSIIAGGAGTQATAVPMLSPAGKLIAIFSVLGLGLLGFAVSRRA